MSILNLCFMVHSQAPFIQLLQIIYPNVGGTFFHICYRLIDVKKIVVVLLYNLR